MFPSSLATTKDRREITGFPFKIAIIDLGTNSVRFDIYEIQKPGEISLLVREKDMIRLGDGLFEKLSLNPQAIARAVESFKRFQQKMVEENVDRVVAFATCALRESRDRQEFINLIREKAGVDLHVISGDEEAMLIAKAITKLEELPTSQLGLVDIGGGSTEISFVKKGKVKACFSLELGANRLKQMFNFQYPIAENSVQAFKECRKFIQTNIRPHLDYHELDEIDDLLGSSGTIRAIRRIIKFSGHPIDPFDRDSLDSLIGILEKMDLDELHSIAGMEPQRADIILPGALLLETIMDEFAAHHVYFTRYNLRDGILEEELERILSEFPKN